MNTKLIESLVQIIQSLRGEEQQLITQRLNRKQQWEDTKSRLRSLQSQIYHEHGQTSLDLVENAIHQGREERDTELMDAFPTL